MNGEVNMKCKYEADNGICVNANCPMCCDYCPIPDGIPGVCRFEEREGDADG